MLWVRDGIGCPQIADPYTTESFAERTARPVQALLWKRKTERALCPSFTDAHKVDSYIWSYSCHYY